ncbi:hypothetical protein HPB51_016473 [Rhipicephalus microplus]|uniref:Uncharacterized protein n=1 Tax=Rhipicephalus microplus TaxID=6941 RepID=A0A9J6DWA8_RHIMP|nr:hypothetical protein HPB51_016473 [Rhipicephalus microplus]
MLYYRAFCVSKALFFSPSLIAKYSVNDFHSKAGAVAKEMVLSIRLAFSRRLSEWPHYNPNIIVVANWSSLDSAFRDFEYDERETGQIVSSDLPDMTQSFVANWQHSVLLNSTRQVIELSYAVRHLWLYSTSWGKRDFNLMPYTLSFPFFDSKLPTSVNFGGFGSEVVDALGSILVGTYRAYSGMQLLFISSCFLLCPGSHRGQENECDIFALHVPEFSQAFQCSQKAIGVNTSEHCQPL